MGKMCQILFELLFITNETLQRKKGQNRIIPAFQMICLALNFIFEEKLNCCESSKVFYILMFAAHARFAKELNGYKVKKSF